MKKLTISVVVGCGWVACASIAGAQVHQKSDQPLRFDETIVVTAAPNAEGTLVKGEPSDYFLTFNTPVGIPGVTLAAGTYLFRFPAGTGAGIIQVLKADSSTEYSMFTTSQIQDSRRDLFSGAQVVTRRERQTSRPPTIREWYLPGRTAGYEFIYPRTR
jgi:hypothetical protein